MRWLYLSAISSYFFSYSIWPNLNFYKSPFIFFFYCWTLWWCIL